MKFKLNMEEIPFNDDPVTCNKVHNDEKGILKQYTIDILINKKDWVVHTGSSRFFSDIEEFRDIDRVIWLDELHPAARKNIIDFAEFYNNEYKPNDPRLKGFAPFVNIKVNNYDFIIVKTYEEFGMWEFATEGIVTYIEQYGELSNGLLFKPNRVAMFEKFKVAYLEAHKMITDFNNQKVHEK